MESSQRQTHRCSSLRLWKTLTAVVSLFAVVMTALFIWHVTLPTQKTEYHEQAKETERQHAAMLACPQLPTLFPLPKPLPERITRVFENLTAVLNSLVDRKASLPAISMNVFYQDDILWSGHFGSKMYREKQNTPDDNTVYRIGSVTKLFVVLFVFKLYEEGKIASIDDPLSKYTPGFEIMNPFTNENVTLREIASQMSGLPREAPCMFSCNTTSAEQLALLRNRTLVLPPWTMPSYSNLGYALLGRLLSENILNQSFESWTTENILKPLEMLNSGFEITENVEKNMAFPYTHENVRLPFMNVGWLAPAGQMYSTISDLAKLGMMFAQPYKQKLFKAATLREIMTPKEIASDGRTVWGSPFEMRFMKDEGILLRGKIGFIDSYTAYFTVVPELGLGLTLLVSTAHYLRSGAWDGVISIGEFAYQILVPALTSILFEEERKAKFPIDSSPYTGHFLVNKTNPFTKETSSALATVKQEGSVLRLRGVASPALEIQIEYIGEKLAFQADNGKAGMSCYERRMGTLADLYYDPPANDGFSHRFKVPGWELVAARVSEERGKSDVADSVF